MTTTAPRKSTPARKRAAAANPPPALAAAAAPTAAADDAWADRREQLEESGPVPAAQAETATEELPDGAIAVPLGPRGDLVHILPRRAWHSSSLTALHEGNLEEWARKCLHTPDYETLWVGLDPTIGEIEEMLAAWQELTGEDLGKARVQRGSLRNTRRR